MSNLSPDQFREFAIVSDHERDSTYPVWHDGETMKTLAAAAVKKAKPYHQIKSMRKSWQN